MANYSAAARTRAMLGVAASKPRPSIYAEQFTDAEWRHSRTLREGRDALSVATRWLVIVVPADNAPRFFYMRGPLEDVRQRALAVFGVHTRVAAIEPASFDGGEVVDRRLSLGETHA